MIELARLIAEVQLGLEDSETRLNLHLQGQFLGDLGRIDEAVEVFLMGLKFNRITEGKQSASVSYSLRALGSILRDNGKFVRVQNFLKQSLAAAEEIHGEKSSKICPDLYALGKLRRVQIVPSSIFSLMLPQNMSSVSQVALPKQGYI